MRVPLPPHGINAYEDGPVMSAAEWCYMHLRPVLEFAPSDPAIAAFVYRDKGQRTRHKGQGTRDKAQGTKANPEHLTGAPAFF
ncbi:MAG: hypothetical protein H0W30_05275 [Gemmatimonadaceae bacterium]|nr:hypothetical protein [Gemmatimonadaceae bacterium]